MEPIVLLTEIVGAVGHYAGHIVVGQDRDVVRNEEKAGIWLSFGDTCWFISEAGTRKLRDFCNAVLACEGKADQASQPVPLQAPVCSDSVPGGPALDAKAANPGGLAADE